MNNRTNIIITLLFAASCAFVSCDDWTDIESIDIKQPSIEEQNPELYTKYLENLIKFKSGDHQVVIVSVNNLGSMPANRSQNLTSLPDSIDYICLNNPLEVNEVNIAEFTEVHRLGTKIVGLLDFDAIESAWKKILEEEKANASIAGETANETEVNDDASRFIDYCKSEMTKQISAIIALKLDGIVMNYTGFDLNSLVEESEIAMETARQAAFFDIVVNWKTTNADKVIFFKGAPQNVINKNLLKDCKYIILNAHSVKNQNGMSYLALMASVKDVPTDRFVIGVTTPYLTNSGSYNGEFGDGSSAILGAAQWAVSKTSDYNKAGISIDAAEQDYFNIYNIYPNIKEAINILSPTVK